MRKILIIDDDLDTQALIAEMLKTQFEPVLASNGRDGLAAAIREQPDLILLDVNMPEMDGFEVVKRIREKPGIRHIPIVMLTSANTLDNRVKGLDLGADDYMAKPFQARELLARINARLRRNEIDRKSGENIELGNLKLDPKSFQIWVADEEIHLTRIEFELLRYFLENPNQVIDRSRLLGDLWPDAVVTNRTVDTHMANLRKKIRAFNCSLETIYGAGYILKTDQC
jgi:DNA-binding response OmpR family regulator